MRYVVNCFDIQIHTTAAPTKLRGRYLFFADGSNCNSRTGLSMSPQIWRVDETSPEYVGPDDLSRAERTVIDVTNWGAITPRPMITQTADGQFNVVPPDGNAKP